MSRLLALAVVTTSVAFLAGSETSAQSTPTFQVVYLGCLDQANSNCFANAINNRGQVVGGSATSTGASHAVLWENGTITDLGALGSDVFSEAYGINSRGQIVGVSGTSRYEGHAVLWENGTITDLGSLPGGSGTSVAFAVNDRGQVVGASGSEYGPLHAVLWQNGTITDLGTVDGPPEYVNSLAYAINNRGQIVGASGEYWVLWENGTIVQQSFTESGVGAYGITNSGEVAGTSAGSGWPRAFMWEDGTVTHLGPTDFPGSSWARAINARGEIVGEGSLALDGPYGAVLWQNGSLTPMLLFEGPSRASGINAPGQIVGTVWLTGAQASAVLWTR